MWRKMVALATFGGLVVGGSAAGRVHTVRRGETLEAIGRTYGVAVPALAAANGLRDPNLVLAGTTLTIPPPVAESGVTNLFEEAMATSASLHEELAGQFPLQAAYAVALAYRIRFTMQMNAREAMHVLELRTSPQGHPAYRAVCLEMWRLIRDQAGHHGLAEAMPFVDTGDYELGRLGAERLAEARRSGSVHP